jgi:hypothetical protein
MLGSDFRHWSFQDFLWLFVGIILGITLLVIFIVVIIRYKFSCSCCSKTEYKPPEQVVCYQEDEIANEEPRIRRHPLRSSSYRKMKHFKF